MFFEPNAVETIIISLARLVLASCCDPGQPLAPGDEFLVDGGMLADRLVYAETGLSATPWKSLPAGGW